MIFHFSVDKPLSQYTLHECAHFDADKRKLYLNKSDIFNETIEWMLGAFFIQKLTYAIKHEIV